MCQLSEDDVNNIVSNIQTYYDREHPKLMQLAENAETEGAIRDAAGNFIEGILKEIFKEINKLIENPIISKVGRTDFLSKQVTYKGKNYTFDQIQVDRHVWHNNKRIAFIENKTYLDACYFDRALADFRKISQALAQQGKDPADCKFIVFAGQNAQKDETRLIYEADFWSDTKHLTNNPEGIIPMIFYIFKGKRQSIKPLYKYKHVLDKNSIAEFIHTIEKLL